MMTITPEELKDRLEHDENRWLKIQQQANKQHADSLNQLADLFGIVRQMQAKINKLEAYIKERI